MDNMLNDMAQYAIVHTAQRGGGASKIENVWMVLITENQVEPLRALLQIRSSNDGLDRHSFELLKLKRGTLTEVNSEIAAAI